MILFLILALGGCGSQDQQSNVAAMQQTRDQNGADAAALLPLGCNGTRSVDWKQENYRAACVQSYQAWSGEGFVEEATQFNLDQNFALGLDDNYQGFCNALKNPKELSNQELDSHLSAQASQNPLFIPRVRSCPIFIIVKGGKLWIDGVTRLTNEDRSTGDCPANGTKKCTPAASTSVYF
jgi:hypothetical protein